MTPDDLARSCIEALSHPERTYHGEPVVGIAGSRKVPLPEKSFPKWKYLTNGPDGKPVYHYPAKQMLAALAHHRLISLNDYYQEPVSS